MRIEANKARIALETEALARDWFACTGGGPVPRVSGRSGHLPLHSLSHTYLKAELQWLLIR